MAEGIVVGAVVTLIIEKVIRCARDALICKRVCKKLEQELVQIRPDVQKIEQQMVHRRRLSAEPLEVVEGWLARLKEKLTEADIEVHRCSSRGSASRLHLKENHDLTRKIQGLLSDIRKLAGNDVSRATLSSSISNGSSHNGSGSSPDTSQHGSSQHGSSQHGSSRHGYGVPQSVDGPFSGFESQGSLIHRQRMDEIDSILSAEDQTRLSMNHRRHTTGSFDFSKPAEQPVAAYVHVEAPVLHFQQQQQQHQYIVQNFQQPGHYYAPQQQGWCHFSSHGHNVHHG